MALRGELAARCCADALWRLTRERRLGFVQEPFGFFFGGADGALVVDEG